MSIPMKLSTAYTCFILFYWQNTAYFGKQIVTGFPRGFNSILELDIFWPLPFEPRVFTNAKDLLFGKTKKRKPLIPPWLNEPK